MFIATNRRYMLIVVGLILIVNGVALTGAISFIGTYLFSSYHTYGHTLV